MEQHVNASIITIGTELLIGQVIDTNSAWIAQELNKEGIWIRKRIAVSDIREDILDALDTEMQSSDIIIITGGLGPTADDITKPLLCEYFGGKMILNEDVLAHIKHLFKNVFNRPFLDRNIQQAEVPDTCTVIHNERGTAPGMWFEKDETVVIALPGVPHEMKGLMLDKVIPSLRGKFKGLNILHRTLLTVGIGESYLAEHILAWEESLPEYLSLAYLPNYGMIRLRLTATGKDKALMEKSLNEQFEQLKTQVSEWLVADEDISMPQLVSRMLKERKKSVASAESCTGGYLAHLLTRESGASDNFKGTVVSYSNEVKENVLGVKKSTLEEHGAVSEETVREMVKGAIKVLNTDYAIATSGIMGPDGATPGKPVGTVWVGVGTKDNIQTQLFHFRFDRMRNIELTANYALNFLRKFMLESES